ncbi:MAG: hypothetical protein OXJ54_07965 [Gemmatimonadetes bacterium]|nr:hypothetical protein [Candidatus Palauibacter rhopaloidicola]
MDGIEALEEALRAVERAAGDVEGSRSVAVSGTADAALENYARGPGLNEVRDATPVLTGRLRARWYAERWGAGRVSIHNPEVYAGLVMVPGGIPSPRFGAALERVREGAERAIGDAVNRELERLNR